MQKALDGYGTRLRAEVAKSGILPLIGVYDVFSATLAAKQFDGIFVSGFGFAASHYGLPDIGFNTWSDLVDFVRRVRTVLPKTSILVDIDDGFADTEVACHVVSLLESAGASGVILEDQARPRRCGHVGGKHILPLELALERLNRVLETRRELFVVARTDATGTDEILRRVKAFSDTEADAILVDGIGDFSMLEEIRSATRKPIVFNQITGGATKARSLEELERAGVSLALFSTPCLFAAQQVITKTLKDLKLNGRLDAGDGGVTLQDCQALLDSNLKGRQIT